MNKKYIYALIGVFVTGQTALSFYGMNYETKKFEVRIESIRLNALNQKQNAELNTSKATQVTYKYKKKKNFDYIENSIMNIQKQTKYLGSGDTHHVSQSARIAKAISGKLLISGTQRGEIND